MNHVYLYGFLLILSDQKNKGGLLSFNNFLSTSINRQVSLDFVRDIIATTSLVGILFVMEIDTSIKSTPFANIRDVSYFSGEEEILFSMHSIFRIGEVKQVDGNNYLWEVQLTLTSDNDPQLHALTDCIRKETFPHKKGWERLGTLLTDLGQFDKAEEVCEMMLDPTTSEYDEAGIYHLLGLIKDNQGKYADAIRFSEKSLKIKQKVLSPTHVDVASSYTNIGLVYSEMGEYSKALLSHEKALEICHKTLPVNHPALATLYNNIGGVYQEMGEHSKALSYYEKAVEIRQKTLPENHPDLATSYSNIAMVYYNMKSYSIALSYLERTLNIWQRSLPPNHPSITNVRNGIKIVKEKMK